MNTDQLNLYMWIIDTIAAHGRISRRELSDLWAKSSQGDGNPIPQRSFFAYRRDIERIFGIEILCDSSYRYYIETLDGVGPQAYREWMLNGYALRHVMNDAEDIADRILVEKIPSAYKHLSSFIDAIRKNKKVSFTYNSYSHALPQDGIILAPYFLKLFRQRWYIIGARKDYSIRTYALDRITNLNITLEYFPSSSVPDPQLFFSDIFGITYSHAEAQTIKLKVQPHYANYLRTLPLHHSQKEEKFTDFSIFRYSLRLTPDLVREIISMGTQVTVLEPLPLRLMVCNTLKETLANYE